MKTAEELLRMTKTMFLTEVSAQCGVSLEEALSWFQDGENYLIVHHGAPDPHMRADLRIVSLVEDAGSSEALERAERLWQDWLSNFLRTHRCA